MDGIHERIPLDEILKDIQTFFPDAIKHATIDTYAKKLHLKGDGDSKKKLLSLKHFLGCFFSFEQTKVSPGKGFSDFHESTISERYKGQELQVDPRYDSFFATLLNTETKSLDDRINIISWNYDLQLELAYQEFYEKENPQVNLGVYPNGLEINESKLREQGGRFRVIKLNGSAGMVFYPERYPSSIKGDFFPKIGKDNDITFQEALEINVPSIECLLKVYSNSLNRDPTESSIQFAWEKNHTSSDKLKFAEELMAATDVLVVIGYSFPNFNRKVDKELLAALPSTKKVKIYYQDDEKRVDGLIQRLRGILPTRPEAFAFDVQPYTDLDQFFIPYEL